MRKITLALVFLLLLFSNNPGVLAQEADPPIQVYLPVIYTPYVDHSSPWLGPVGGPVVVIQSHPSDGKILYAGTWGAGVFKTTDAGQTWSAMNDGLGNYYINSMAIDPINPRIVYAGTYKDKLYKSTNGGETWYQSSAGIQADAIIYAITIDPNNPDILFIGTRGTNTSGAPPWKGVVYRSTNEGINWTPVLQNVPRRGENTQDWAYDLIVNPKNSQIVFAAFHEAGIYKSTNGGNSWFASNTGISESSGLISARGLSINPAGTSSNALYMGTWHRVGTFKSTDNAANWINTALDVKVYNMDLDNSAPNVLYLANFDAANNKGGVYKSSNSGDSWSLAGLGKEILYTVAVNQPHHTQVFAGTLTNGIYRSDDSGSSWNLASQGLFNTNVSGMLALLGSTTTLIGSTASNGVSISQDRGVTWSPLNNGLTDKVVNDLVSNPANPNQLFALTASGGLFKCTLPTCSWTTSNSGIPSSAFDPAAQMAALLDENQIQELTLAGVEPFADVGINASSYSSLTELVFSTSNRNIAYLGTVGAGLRRSSDNGSTWAPAGLSGKTVNSVAVDPRNSRIVYAATTVSGVVYTSVDSGSNWSTTNIAGGVVNSLSISPVNPTQVYAGTAKGVYVRSGTGNWQLLGLSGIKINQIAASPQQMGVLVAGTDQGAYYSTNNGVDWKFVSDEIANLTIRMLQFDPNYPSRVYLGTTSVGTYRFYLP